MTGHDWAWLDWLGECEWFQTDRKAPSRSYDSYLDDEHICCMSFVRRKYWFVLDQHVRSRLQVNEVRVMLLERERSGLAWSLVEFCAREAYTSSLNRLKPRNWGRNWRCASKDRGHALSPACTAGARGRERERESEWERVRESESGSRSGSWAIHAIGHYDSAERHALMQDSLYEKCPKMFKDVWRSFRPWQKNSTFHCIL